MRKEDRLIGAIVISESELNSIGLDQDKFRSVLREKMAHFELDFFKKWLHNRTRKWASST